MCILVSNFFVLFCFLFCVCVVSSASGVLKGFDPLLNLVLDGTIEYMRDPDDQYKLTEDTRQLGLVVCRGTSVVLICPQDGMEAIPNPFIQQQEG
uniref:LSM7 homolog, U6 small nuclear RNA and mRNA degradation associated n=1 Tax=Chrysemys picta bellii TaxID=8478 RepID=A0A8C3IBD2_CHRPI